MTPSQHYGALRTRFLQCRTTERVARRKGWTRVADRCAGEALGLLVTLRWLRREAHAHMDTHECTAVFEQSGWEFLGGSLAFHTDREGVHYLDEQGLGPVRWSETERHALAHMLLNLDAAPRN